jgi:hypothetical protein
MTHVLRQTVKDKITEINPTSYPTLLTVLDHLTPKALGELLDLLHELEARAERDVKQARQKRFHRY